MISQELWAYFDRNHSLTLLDSELDDILHTVNSERELKIQRQAAAIDAAERRNAALAEALSDAVTSMLDSGYAPAHLIIRKARAALSLTASSGPEQTKWTPEAFKAWHLGSTEPKCVCPDHDLMAVPHTIICNDFVAMKNPENKKCGRCAHIRACHTPAPAAKEVSHD